VPHKDWDEWTEELDNIDPYEEDDKPPATSDHYDWSWDSRNIRYNENAGSQTPTKGRCNALLVSWEERYGEPRYCTRIPERFYKCEGDSNFCKKHKGREGLMQRAKEMMSHGMFSKTFMHYFDKSDPVEKVFVTALFESLIERSKYDFDVGDNSIELDFSDSEREPERHGVVTDDEDKAVIYFPEPTQNHTPALALLEASVDEVKMLKANSDIFADNMKSESTEVAATTDDGRIGETIEEVSEHYLNLPYSRLVKDHKENLKRGGVDIEGVEATDDIEATKNTYDRELPKPDSGEEHIEFIDESSGEVVEIVTKDADEEEEGVEVVGEPESNTGEE